MCFELINCMNESINTNIVDFFPWSQHANYFGSVNFCCQSAWWRQFVYPLSSLLPRSCSWQTAASVDRDAERRSSEKWGGCREAKSLDPLLCSHEGFFFPLVIKCERNRSDSTADASLWIPPYFSFGCCHGDAHPWICGAELLFGCTNINNLSPEWLTLPFKESILSWWN